VRIIVFGRELCGYLRRALLNTQHCPVTRDNCVGGDVKIFDMVIYLKKVSQ